MRSNEELRTRLYIASLAVLLVGLCVAVLIYATAEESTPDAIAFVVVDGLKYPIEPNQSKRYIRDLERFGGKASVIFDEFSRWFSGLWSGRRLAFTVGVLSIAVSFVLFLFAGSLPPDPD